MTDAPASPALAAHPPRGPRRRRLTAIAALVLAAGLGAGAAGLALHGNAATMIALNPVPITAMAEATPAAIKGEVTEIYGKAFILQDPSGHALVDTGPEGEDGGLVAKAETVTVQGRFDHGVMHAAALTHADGHTDLVGPPGPPPHGGPLAWVGRRLRLPPG